MNSFQIRHYVRDVRVLGALSLCKEDLGGPSAVT